MKILVTGSGGLIGSEAVRFFDNKGHDVVGVDNNMRRVFFGPDGDITWNLQRLEQQTHHFVNYSIDIRDRPSIEDLFKKHKFNCVIHCAAQPAHTKAYEIPVLDFEVNALEPV